MNKTLNESIAIYKAQLENGEIQMVYERLIKYVMAIKAHFEKNVSNKYSFGNVSPGYMDFTYFPFFNDYLRSKKLRFGVVLNHQNMRFELWLMGQNGKIQKEYWDLLKDTKWNKDQATMPKYSVLEVVLVEQPDFNNLDKLTAIIVGNAELFSEEIINDLISKTNNR